MPSLAEKHYAASPPDPLRAAEVTSALDRYLSQTLTESKDNAPKHRQLSNALIAAMAAGVLREGDKLPSESTLTLMTPFSLGTVQKALGALMQDGFIDRKPGAGTIVKAWRQSMTRPLHCRFAGDDGAYLPVFPKVIGRHRVETRGRWSEALGATDHIIRIDRRIMIGDLFLVTTRFYVRADRFPLFADYPLRKLDTENFKLLMAEETGRPVAHMDHRLTLVPADADIAALIDVPPGQHILHIKAVASASGGEALYFQEFYVPPNELELSIESRLDGITGI